MELFNINDGGQLGVGTTSDEIFFTKVVNNAPQEFENDNITSISAGYHYSLIIRNGIVYSCGNNNYGQLGIGTNSGGEMFFTKAVNDSQNFQNDNVITISEGMMHSLLIKNGIVYSCGFNFQGQLGIGTSGTNNDKNIFTKVVNNSPEFINENVSIISAGGFYSLIIELNKIKKIKYVKKIQLNNNKCCEKYIWNTLSNISQFDFINNAFSTGANESSQLGLGDVINRNVFNLIDI